MIHLIELATNPSPAPTFDVSSVVGSRMQAVGGELVAKLVPIALIIMGLAFVSQLAEKFAPGMAKKTIAEAGRPLTDYERKSFVSRDEFIEIHGSADGWYKAFGRSQARRESQDLVYRTRQAQKKKK